LQERRRAGWRPPQGRSEESEKTRITKIAFLQDDASPPASKGSWRSADRALTPGCRHVRAIYDDFTPESDQQFAA
jgi:hypothetical protein